MLKYFLVICVGLLLINLNSSRNQIFLRSWTKLEELNKGSWDATINLAGPEYKDNIILLWNGLLLSFHNMSPYIQLLLYPALWSWLSRHVPLCSALSKSTDEISLFLNMSPYIQLCPLVLMLFFSEVISRFLSKLAPLYSALSNSIAVISTFSFLNLSPNFQFFLELIDMIYFFPNSSPYIQLFLHLSLWSQLPIFTSSTDTNSLKLYRTVAIWFISSRHFGMSDHENFTHINWPGLEDDKFLSKS